MPALPEIEVVRRDLEKEIVGRRIKDAEIRSGTNAMKVVPRHGRRKEFQELLGGAKVESIDRVGRRLLLILDNEKILVVELGEAGMLVKTSASEEVVTHTHVVISFTIGGQLRFIDPKMTGELSVVDKAEIDGWRETVSTSIDPLSQQFTWVHFSALLEQRDAPMKEVLTDQEFILGLGDIYSDEILFNAGLRFDRPSNKLSSQDVRRLYRALMETLQDAVKARGVSIDDSFKDLQGESGTYQLDLKVYEREGEACRRCRNAIEKVTVGSMTSYFCPQCQS